MSESHGVGKDTTAVMVWLTLRPPGTLKMIIFISMVGRKLEREGGEATGARNTEIIFPKNLVEKRERNRSDDISFMRRGSCLKGGGSIGWREMKEGRELDNRLGFVSKKAVPGRSARSYPMSVPRPSTLLPSPPGQVQGGSPRVGSAHCQGSETLPQDGQAEEGRERQG